MSAWRERAEDGARPRSVGAVVRAVRASLHATHAAESVLLFAAGWLLARCALLVEGVPGGSGAHFVALLCGALAAATWWLEHRVGLAPTARVLDQRLRHHGALVTAFELERGPASARDFPTLTSMEQLVRLRVLERLRTRAALRAVFPPLLLPIGAPTVAALLFVLLSDARRAEAPPPLDYGALAEGLGRALALGGLDPEVAGLEGADDDGGLSRAQVQHLNEVLGARRALPFAPDEWTREPAALRAQLDELDRKMAGLAAEVAPGSELHGRLEEARTWVDALRMGLAPAAGPAEAAGSQGSVPGSKTEPPTNGTISGSTAAPDARPMPSEPSVPPDLPTAPGAPSPAAPALGLQAGNWWPGEYDGVVERWIELSRAAEAGGR